MAEPSRSQPQLRPRTGDDAGPVGVASASTSAVDNPSPVPPPPPGYRARVASPGRRRGPSSGAGPVTVSQSCYLADLDMKTGTTRTLNPLPFQDMEPHRFEDLVRQLAYEMRPWKSLEAIGRTGSDEGIDIRAIEAPPERSIRSGMVITPCRTYS